jgi:RHS repeat-associated protein
VTDAHPLAPRAKRAIPKPTHSNPGESPRSNLVFTKWGDDPMYVRNLDGGDVSVDSIAERRESAPELIACWQSNPLSPMISSDAVPGLDLAAELAPVSESQPIPPLPSPQPLRTAPMRVLGSLPNPPWALLNLHTDHLGTVRLITDGAGSVVSEHKYFPFGESTTAEAPSHNSHKFTGHERDGESGLDYMTARYYEAGVGRFLSSDPSDSSARRQSPQSWNRYAFANNSPVRFFDPDGRESLSATGNAHEAIVAINNRGTAGIASASRADAIGDAREHFKLAPNAEIKDGESINAFIHADGACRMAVSLGGTVATEFLNAHESGDPTNYGPNQAQMTVDLANNALGVSLAEGLPSPDQCPTAVAGAQDDLTTIDDVESGQLPLATPPPAPRLNPTQGEDCGGTKL